MKARNWLALGAAALLTLTAPMAAQAQWRDHGGRGGGGGGGRGDSQRGYGREGGGYGRGGGGYGQRFGGDPGRGGGYGQRGYGAPTYEPQPYRGGGGGGGGFRRGQVLPPERRGAYVPDPGRYHLRAPPPGYGWVGDGRNAYLTQRSTGMVLDSVPGAYEPAPAYRGRGRRR